MSGVRYVILDGPNAYYEFGGQDGRTPSMWGTEYWLNRFDQLGIVPAIDPDLLMDKGL